MDEDSSLRETLCFFSCSKRSDYRRGLFELPPVLHGQADICGASRHGGEVSAQVEGRSCSEGPSHRQSHALEVGKAGPGKDWFRPRGGTASEIACHAGAPSRTQSPSKSFLWPPEQGRRGYRKLGVSYPASKSNRS